jgi:hypothetical protein
LADFLEKKQPVENTIAIARQKSVSRLVMGKVEGRNVVGGLVDRERIFLVSCAGEKHFLCGR